MFQIYYTIIDLVIHSFRLRSRHQIKLWAVIVIQKAFRNFLKTKKLKVEQKRIMEKNKRRWKKKIGGDDYIADNDDLDSNDGFNMDAINDELEPLTSNDALLQEYEYKRRNEFKSEPNSNGNVLNAGVGQIATSHDHRRKRFDELRSFEQRKKEDKLNEVLMRSFD